MYDKVTTDLNFLEREKKVLELWKEKDVFKESMAQRKGGTTFTFYDGPPTANGKPHIGHILTRVIKDIIPRYRTMKGYHVLRKAGWDTHGLPVELEVEKNLGINGKPAIEEYGIEPFVQECKKSVWKYKGEWERMSERVGYWADMDNPYITYDNNYIESIWWSLKQLWDKDLLYKGHKIVPYCPRCGTSLSSHEVAQGYKDVEETSIFVRFRVKGLKNEYILAWTTTPWTLPSNVALCVRKDVSYAKVSMGGETFIMAEALLEKVLGEGYEIIEKIKGKDLEGLEYEPLFPYADTQGKKAFYVTCDNFVTLTDGTGVVHIAPAFGEDDAKVGYAYDLPFVQLVNEQGAFVESVTPWKGVFVKTADPMIVTALKEAGLLLRTQDYSHSYPFCWRCDTPLLYYARASWFIRVTQMKKELIKNNRSVNWMPENIKEGRMGDFLENVIDWGLSRERYWGTPLPIWECACTHRELVGSIAELKEKGKNVPEDIELHRPYIDRIALTCPKCGGTMRRVSEVIDCWYDSGAMPFAQWHFPFENKELFEQNFPADFISEAIDQTRGWFYSLLAISTLLFGESSFKNCVVLGHVNDKEGFKMSKHKGNVVDPWSVLDKQGADAVRWYFYASSAPWLPTRFYEEAVSEAQRKFMGTLWNTYAFFVLYANIDDFNPKGLTPDVKALGVMDRWILARLHALIGQVDQNLENYRITESARAIEAFVDDLSNWYVRRGRERYWGKGMTKDKQDAFLTLHTVLTTVSKLIAPFVPFLAEELYQNLVAKQDENAPQSVHWCDFPKSDSAFIDADLEENMARVLDIVVLGRSCRNTANLKTRQPIAQIFVKAEKELPPAFCELVKDELNAKAVVFTKDATAFTTYKLKPQMRTVGPKYGKLLGGISQYLSHVDANKAMLTLQTGGMLRFEVSGEMVELSMDDVLYESANKEGFMAESDRGVTVVLNTNLTPELIEEGFVREIVSKVQTMRREADFEVTDHIHLSYSGNARIESIMQKFSQAIAQEVLADSVTEGRAEGSKEWDINREKVMLSVRKISNK